MHTVDLRNADASAGYTFKVGTVRVTVNGECLKPEEKEALAAFWEGVPIEAQVIFWGYGPFFVVDYRSGEVVTLTDLVARS